MVRNIVTDNEVVRTNYIHRLCTRRLRLTYTLAVCSVFWVSCRACLSAEVINDPPFQVRLHLIQLLS